MEIFLFVLLLVSISMNSSLLWGPSPTTARVLFPLAFECR